MDTNEEGFPGAMLRNEGVVQAIRFETTLPRHWPRPVSVFICVHLWFRCSPKNKNASHGGCEAWAFIPDWRDERYSVAVVAQRKIMAGRYAVRPSLANGN
jgi:hypothetical protein